MVRAALVPALLGLVALVSAPTGSAQDCPPQVFLAYASNAYVGETVPAPESFPHGAVLGDGLLDLPAGTEGGRCAREQAEAVVVRLEGIDPLVAVGVQGRPSQVFVLGNKCTAITEPAHWTCLRTPLAFDGRDYVATAYPPEATTTLAPGEPLGTADLGGEEVEVVAIAGVDPAVAVGVPGDEKTAYVAVGTCQYERFDTPVQRDDLGRCLEAPVWFVFNPAGGPPGDPVTARADRTLAPELDGATVTLVRSTVSADVVPSGGARAEVFQLAPEAGQFRFELPDLEPGRYEAVVRCEACADEAGGRTEFPAGSLLIVEGGGGGAGASTSVIIAVGVVFLGALALSIYMWRRTRALRRAARGAGAGDQGGIS